MRIACFLEVEIGEVLFFLVHFSGPGGPGLAHFSRKIHLSALLVSHLFSEECDKKKGKGVIPFFLLHFSGRPH